MSYSYGEVIFLSSSSALCEHSYYQPRPRIVEGVDVVAARRPMPDQTQLDFLAALQASLSATASQEQVLDMLLWAVDDRC